MILSESRTNAKNQSSISGSQYGDSLSSMYPKTAKPKIYDLSNRSFDKISMQSPINSCLGSIAQKESPHSQITKNQPQGQQTPNSLKDQMVKMQNMFGVFKSQDFTRSKTQVENKIFPTVTQRKREKKEAWKAHKRQNKGIYNTSENETQVRSEIDSSTKNSRSVKGKTMQQKDFLNFLYVNCNGKQPGKNILQIVAPGLGLSVHQIQKWFWEENKKQLRNPQIEVTDFSQE